MQPARKRKKLKVVKVKNNFMYLSADTDYFLYVWPGRYAE